VLFISSSCVAFAAASQYSVVVDDQGLYGTQTTAYASQVTLPLAQFSGYYFASAAVAVDSCHMTASSYAPWSRFSPPSNFVNGHLSTMWFVVCRWPQSQESDMGLDLSGNGSSEIMYDEGDRNLAVG